MTGTKIEWTNVTWNPTTGCSRGCEYCFARPLARRLKRMGLKAYQYDDPFKPRFHEERLEIPFKWNKPRMVFVDSMGDLFDPQIEESCIYRVLEVINQNPRHTFQVLTKRTEVLNQFHFPKNLWIGISQDGKYTSATGIRDLAHIEATAKFISFEPLLGEIYPILGDIDWVIIGAQTGPGAKKPEREWVENIIYLAREENIPIFLKDNLNWPERIQEWPTVGGNNQ